MTNLLALPAGTELGGEYRIVRVLGAGGFGITYLAEEIALARAVTIKEYFPSEFAARGDDHSAVPRSSGSTGDYAWGLERFIDEAQTLARFDHRHIVRVYRYFRANNTAYMVLHFEEGQSLKAWLKDLKRAPRQKELDRIVAPLLDALEVIHKADYLHRDIAPDNIIIRTDGTPVLIDFGSARGEIAQHTRTVSALVKPGYSPYEQYAETGKKQGPWTDIYALAATLYHVVTGKRPPDSPSRVVKDEIVPAREAALAGYRAGFLAAIDRALTLEIEKRPPSVAAWRGDLLAPDSGQRGWLQRTLRIKQAEPAAEPPPPAAAPVAADAAPPPPDAPGAKGGLLDYIDALRGKPAPASAAKELAAPDKRSEAKGVAVVARASEPVAKRQPAGLVPTPRKALKAKTVPEPRRKRARRSWVPSWRPLAFKFLIGIAIATAAVGLQDQLPKVEVRGNGGVSSGVPETLLVKKVAGHAGGTRAIALTEDGRSLVTVGADATLKIWQVSTGVLTRTLELDHGAASALALAGGRALTGHHNGTIALWDLERGEKLATFQRNDATIRALAFAGSPARFVAATHDQSVTLWDVPSKAALHTFAGHENDVQAVAFGAKGPYIATGGADRTVRLWDPVSLSLVRTYRGHRDFVAAVAFSPDGRLVVSGSLDGSIRIWSSAAQRLHRVMLGHRGAVTALAFVPAGGLIASAGEDGTVRLWDVRRGRSVRTLGSSGGAINAVAFTPDGQRVAAAGDDGAIWFWDASAPPSSSAEARARPSQRIGPLGWTGSDP